MNDYRLPSTLSIACAFALAACSTDADDGSADAKNSNETPSMDAAVGQPDATLVVDAGFADAGQVAMDAGAGPSPLDILVGTVWVQDGGVGHASYHFDAADDIYIDYSRPGAFWLTDSGNPFPLKKNFIETSFNPQTNTFVGAIDWSDNTVNGGEARWEYRITFDPTITTITGGTFKSFDANGFERTTRRFGQDLLYRKRTADNPYPWSRIGSCVSLPLQEDQIIRVAQYGSADCSGPQRVFVLSHETNMACCQFAGGAVPTLIGSIQCQGDTISYEFRELDDCAMPNPQAGILQVTADSTCRSAPFGSVKILTGTCVN